MPPEFWKAFAQWHPAAVWGMALGVLCFVWFIWLTVKGDKDQR